MKKLFLTLLLLAAALSAQAKYNDHRDRHIDSLERVVASWTPERLSRASEQEWQQYVLACDGLMMGYSQINRERSRMYARRNIRICTERKYWYRRCQAYNMLGRHHYAEEHYDSALFYYNLALEDTERMRGLYEERMVDDNLSMIYGAIGNLYNMMDSIDVAMSWYAKAGEIFERYDWKESNAVLHYNLGETWLDNGDYTRAEKEYRISLDYAKASGDSMMVASAQKGLGALYLRLDRPSEARSYLEEAEKYYFSHSAQEFQDYNELLNLKNEALAREKQQWKRGMIILGGIILFVLLVGAILLLRRRVRILRRQKAGADDVIGEAMAALGDSGEDTPLHPSAILEDGSTLTDREAEILPLIAEGLTSPQIAEKLFLSLPTIKWHRKKLLRKFDAANTAELISKAKERGMI